MIPPPPHPQYTCLGLRPKAPFHAALSSDLRQFVWTKAKQAWCCDKIHVGPLSRIIFVETAGTRNALVMKDEGRELLGCCSLAAPPAS